MSGGDYRCGSAPPGCLATSCEGRCQTRSVQLCCGLSPVVAGGLTPSKDWSREEVTMTGARRSVGGSWPCYSRSGIVGPAGMRGTRRRGCAARGGSGPAGVHDASRGESWHDGPGSTRISPTCSVWWVEPHPGIAQGDGGGKHRSHQDTGVGHRRRGGAGCRGWGAGGVARPGAGRGAPGGAVASAQCGRATRGPPGRRCCQR